MVFQIVVKLSTDSQAVYILKVSTPAFSDDGRARPCVLLPVIQLVIRVRDSDARVFKFAEGTCYVSGRHVVPRLVVVSYHQDASVMTIRGKDNEIVQVFEVP